MERFLAYLAVGIAALSFIALFALLIAPLFGADLAASWIWPACMAIAMYGFPAAFILLVVFVVWRVVVNRRTQRAK